MRIIQKIAVNATSVVAFQEDGECSPQSKNIWLTEMSVTFAPSFS